jgi:hypothetical protein
MDDRLTDFSLRALAVALTVAGLVAVLIGYLGVRNRATWSSSCLTSSPAGSAASCSWVWVPWC